MKWTEEVGLAVVKRDLVSLQLRSPYNKILDFTILQVFPFTSETKRMGIIVKVIHMFRVLILNFMFLI